VKAVKFDEEKYPKYFLAIGIIYLAILVMNIMFFIAPLMGAGVFDAEFLLLVLLLLIPLIVGIFYIFDEKFHWIVFREALFRYFLIALMLVAIGFSLAFLVPIWLLF